MTKYTLETLLACNTVYNYHHGLNESDVQMVNQMVELIENSRTEDRPQLGDMVQFTSKHGDYYGSAHVDELKGEELYICEKPYTPFITAYGNKISVNASGGAWTHIPANLKLVGKQEKAFCEWGHGGARANGAVTFYAEVNVWEYVDGEHEFTTKTHDKFYVSVRDEIPSSGYKYVVTKGGTSHTAFKTDEEYGAWLKTFHGVEREGFLPNSRIVWAYKQETYHLTLHEYECTYDGVIDSELNNGVIQECKRVYDGTTVTTYLPYANNMIEMDGKPCYMNAY